MEDDEDFMPFKSPTRKWPESTGSQRLQSSTMQEPHGRPPAKQSSERKVPFKKKSPAEPAPTPTSSTVPSKKFQFVKAKSQVSQTAQVPAKSSITAPTPASSSTSTTVSKCPPPQVTPKPAKANFVIEDISLIQDDDDDEFDIFPSKPGAGECQDQGQPRQIQASSSVPKAPPVQTPTSSKKFHFKSKKSSQTPSEIPALVLTPSNSETLGKSSSSASASFGSCDTSFNDDVDEDDFFSAEFLEQIEKLEKSSASEEDGDQKKEEPKSSRKQSEIRKEDNATDKQEVTFVKPTMAPSVSKKFKFQKQKSPKSLLQSSKIEPVGQPMSSSSFHGSRSTTQSNLPQNRTGHPHTSLPSAKEDDVFEDGDDFFLSDMDLNEIIALEKSCDYQSKPPSPSPSGEHESLKPRQPETSSKPSPPPPPPNQRPPAETSMFHYPKPFPYDFPPLPGSVAADEDWKKFHSSFATDKRFQAPWVQSIPINGLNLAYIRSLASLSSNLSESARFAHKCLLPFLKELKGGTTDPPPDAELEIGPNMQEVYYCELALELQRVLLLIEKEKDAQSPTFHSLRQTKEYQDLLQELDDSFFESKLDFSMTSIPEILVRLHPPLLEKVISISVKTGTVTFLIPICSTSQSNFIQVLNALLSWDPKADIKPASEEDSDFIDPDRNRGNNNISANSKLVATDLVKSLKDKVGVTEFIKLLPYPFQSLFAIEVALSTMQNPQAKLNNEEIAQQIFASLNFALCGGGNHDFVKFMISLLPLVQDLLNDKLFTRRYVRFKSFPNLWQFLRVNFK